MFNWLEQYVERNSLDVELSSNNAVPEPVLPIKPPTNTSNGSFKRTRLPPLRPTLRLTEEPISVDIHNEEPVKEEHKASSPNYRLMSKDPRKLIEIIEKKEIEFKDMERVLVAAETAMMTLRRENERLTQQLAARLTYTGNDVEFLIRNAVI
jgi:hypothetical protein